ncbi:Fibrinogen-like protein A [Holothuria leucospilota]|uniref:Fibrinogen-like protein A n=1 Tax=Holothuria leucospilota TaxID=206669 RepID=A0A9Q1BUL2_HOLLE|nr:Fibrinogen-like protein A [Holothuria leucospilota]
MYLILGRSCIYCVLLISIGTEICLTSQTHGQPTDEGVIPRQKRDINDANGSSYFYFQQPEYPRDCQEVYDECQNTLDGVYLIKPDGYSEPFEVFCNNTIDSGGWTVFQRRMDGGVDFYRDWVDYKTGFGFLHREFWLGNEKIAFITNQKDYEMRLDMVDSSGSTSYAYYNLFRISDEGTKYSLVEVGSYNGTIGLLEGHDYLATHRGHPFSTRDRDNDNRDTGEPNCAVHHHGAWWYTNCYSSNLNGDYQSSADTGLCLYDSTNSNQCNFRFTEMKIRPTQTNR